MNIYIKAGIVTFKKMKDRMKINVKNQDELIKKGRIEKSEK